MINAREFSDCGVSCLHPVRLRNKYDHLWYTVPCRKCAACAESRRKSIVSRLETLRENSASSFFITLTYDYQHAVYADFDLKHDIVRTSWYSSLHRRRVKEDVPVSSASLDLSSVDRLLLKRGSVDTKGHCLGPDCFLVLRKKDLQLFFKRFRKIFNLYVKGSSHFKYYAIGEYGGECFRPHYHLLVYLDTPFDAERLYELVCRAWRYGFVDFQRVKSSASSYCASYINATACLPAFLRGIRQFNQFSCCSCGSFFEMWPEQVEEFYKEKFFNVPLLHSVQTKAGYALRSYSRSTRLQFYPVVPGFHQLGFDEVLQRMSVFRNAVESQGTQDPCFELTLFHPAVDDVDDNSEFALQEVSFARWSDLYAFSVSPDSDRKRTCSSVLHSDFMNIYQSKRVFDAVRKYFSPADFTQVCKTIIEYYRGSSCDVGYVDASREYRMYSDRDTLELPNSSFELSLLRSQYGVMEKNVNTFDDLALYYNQYNGFRTFNEFCKFSDRDCNLIYDDDTLAFTDLLAADNSVNLSMIEGFSALKSFVHIKHKEKNTYWNMCYNNFTL